ncbi:hypothetical protein MHLP_04110 [Candidatus Mycoplasma haematolamae str. Purdue]|uniref:Uncharacterized protein n=1 Tax=Mycoplasma haematolamae (strain Purdue) TaxID=1212765 RepID=I7C761_MYCHA|nr:hypothetical protein [Candidatus Mycoplasma haematolamae]AFO52402.1 hypothetical protein MHLP_04110 [Candidatus Mycoplasma haematolamae str. Purdue]
MNIWAKYFAGCTALLCTTGTAAKVTYDISFPEAGKWVKVKRENAGEVVVQLPERLDIDIPESSKLKMRLGRNSSGNCIEITYSGVTENEGKGGLFLLGTLENETYLGHLPLCGNKSIWTISSKEDQPKKLICDSGYVLRLDQDKSHLKCMVKQTEDYMNEEKYEFKFKEGDEKVTCTRKQYTNQVTCESKQGFSLKYTAINDGGVKPAIEITKT